MSFSQQQQEQLSSIVEREVQRRSDTDHLKLLSIGFYIQSGISLLASLYGLLYIFLGMMGGTGSRPGDPFPMAIFVGMGIAIFAGGLLMAALNLMAGRSLTRKQNLTLIQILAGLSCLNVPYGTALGVLTFMVLGRPTVKALFEGRDPYGPPPPGTPGAPEEGNWYRSQGGGF
ncbi:hypothetical protein [Armatimonas sp.]|uniref:hypothetical protein n=1 Tax=Armatimonas sp. TaxID=1872638 RepID=UPI00286CF41B|nr:hypothetical protein [Armatimonas sp.]